ncbi:hydantoinase/oxoprolinase family protein [Acuticoccus sp. MNP-M23]|uniref:hydantoinase/oxoprolinase family protein n=1 Tax=Acuticoccus sp. MNP-M23 TaxID=3072793 RepID=UPI0028155B06|nr:hydantoinase/oxoprolinase family protein [Acuticoccus sp. MNP-M23]WMS42583.1 hydantoinase/oxoprolinase family protein [Acuticoccus sp. MNP-M23]
MSDPNTTVGVDVGGTFTDLFHFDETTRTFRTAKVPSNRGDEAAGFLAGLQSFGAVADLASVVHGTTVGTNALLERKGARVGIITTAGFRDVLEMRRRDRKSTWGLSGDFMPVVPRDMRLEVSERTLASGEIRTAVDVAAVRDAAETLRDKGAEALVIVFINAYANPANEDAALEAARDVWPNEHVGCSSAILPEIREFERTSTATLNAYLQPVVGNYLAKLEAALASQNFDGRFHIVQSNGGVMSTAMARRIPARTALSGPAAGVIAAAAIAEAAGFPDVVTGDLGGTSFDCSLIVAGKTALSAQTTIDFGLVIRNPMIEINTIGAGGGSIAHVDAGGLLEVGPESAGSVPGPVCYGAGNDRPTLTDANVVLGRINADKPIGGALKRLDVEAAKVAIDTHVAQKLGLSVMEAAEAIVKIADSKMAGAIRLMSVERGHEPSRFAAVPFGGGGALHAGAMIKEVGLKAALVPRYPGVTSALGCIIADIRHDQVQTLNMQALGLDAAALGARMASEAASAHAVVKDARLAMERIDTVFELDMHYVGQTHTLAVPIDAAYDGGPVCVTEDMVKAAFEAAYQASFSRLLPGVPMRIVNLRTTAIGVRPRFDLAALAPTATGTVEAAQIGTRPVWFDGAWHDTAIYARLDLPVGSRIEGPAILEQPDATTVVDPDLSARIDKFGNLIMEPK